MRLVYPGLGLMIEMKDRGIYTVIAENQGLFYKMVSDLYGQINGSRG